MPGTRQSARIASQNKNSRPVQNGTSPAGGRKRQTEAASTSHSAKRGKKSAGKEPKVIEETVAQ